MAALDPTAVVRPGPARRRHRCVAAVVALVVAAGASACSSSSATDASSSPTTGAVVEGDDSPTTTGATAAEAERPTVVVIGDSITLTGTAQLTEVLGDRWELAIDGRSGYTTEQQVAAADELASVRPDQVVVNLGTNDAVIGVDPARSRAALEAIVADFPDARCIHLVDVNEHMVWGGDDTAAEAAAVNAEIDAVAASDPRIDVVGWSAIVAERIVPDDPEDLMRVDTVHPTPAGLEVLAQAYRDALSSCG